MVLHPLVEQSCCALLSSDPPGSAGNWWMDLLVWWKLSISYRCWENRAGPLKALRTFQCHSWQGLDEVRRSCFAFCPPKMIPVLVSGDALQFVTFLWRRIKSEHHLMMDAEMRTQAGIPPLSAHHLNLPSSGRRVRVYLSLLQWSAWPSSAPHTLRRTHSFTSTQGGSANLCSLQHAWTHLHVPTLSKLRVLLSLSTVSLFCPSIQRDSGVEEGGGGGGLRCCSSAGPTSQLPHCSPSPPSGKLIRSRVPGPSAWALPPNHPTSMSFYFWFMRWRNKLLHSCIIQQLMASSTSRSDFANCPY